MKGQAVLPYLLRPLRREDIVQVAQIEREAFPTLWPPPSLKRELNNRLARYLVVAKSDSPDNLPVPEPPPPTQRWYRRFFSGVRNLFPSEPPIVPTGDLVAGFVGIWYMVDEAHITAVAVREGYRGQGLGELLLIGAVELSMARGSRVATLEVRVSNHVAQRLYEKYGFLRAGIRKGYYTDDREDALVMTTDPIGTPAYQALFRRRVEEFAQQRGEAVRVYE